MAESLHIELPSSIEEYFHKRMMLRTNMRYKHNVCTMATDGPSIVQIAQPHLAIMPHKVLVETSLVALPTRQRPPDEKVKTIFLL